MSIVTARLAADLLETHPNVAFFIQITGLVIML